jgi:hypothetical protein
MTTSYIENDGLKICAKFLNKFIASDPLIDMSFDLESGLAAKQFYEKFKNDLKFLSCIYDKENLINFNNLVLFIALNFCSSSLYEDKNTLDIKIAKICLPKFEALIKENLDNLDNQTSIDEIFETHFAHLVPPVNPKGGKWDLPGVLKFDEIKPFLVDPNNIDELFKAHTNWINQCNFDYKDSKFDEKIFDLANEFYDGFISEPTFLSFIYDEENLINFKNLVFMIGEFFELSYDLKIKLAPQVAKIVHPKFLVSIKKGSGDFKNHKKLTYKEIFDLYFGFERMKSYYFLDNE